MLGHSIIGFVVDKVALGQGFLPVLLFPQSVSFYQCSTLIFNYVLLLPEEQTGEAWEPSNKTMLFRETGSIGQRSNLNPYPTAFPYGNGMVLHFYQQQESSTTKTVHKVINKGLKAYV